MPIMEVTAVERPPSTDNEEDKEPEPKMKKIKFEKTPLMSTYLVGIAIAEFDFIEESIQVNCYSDDAKKEVQSTKTVPIRVYTPVGQKEEV
jgi:aminopeptidase N